MARSKVDGIVEAVRYGPDGQVEIVRVYERRGPTWSDRMLLTRQELIERLKSGQKFVIGQRMKLLGGTFETGPAVRLSGPSDWPVLVTDQNRSERDDLHGGPLI